MLGPILHIDKLLMFCDMEIDWYSRKLLEIINRGGLSVVSMSST